MLRMQRNFGSRLKTQDQTKAWLDSTRAIPKRQERSRRREITILLVLREKNVRECLRQQQLHRHQQQQPQQQQRQRHRIDGMATKWTSSTRNAEKIDTNAPADARNIAARTRKALGVEETVLLAELIKWVESWDPPSDQKYMTQFIGRI